MKLRKKCLKRKNSRKFSFRNIFCINPKCRKPFYSRDITHRWCSKECYSQFPRGFLKIIKIIGVSDDFSSSDISNAFREAINKFKTASNQAAYLGLDWRTYVKLKEIWTKN